MQVPCGRSGDFGTSGPRVLAMHSRVPSVNTILRSDTRQIHHEQHGTWQEDVGLRRMKHRWLNSSSSMDDGMEMIKIGVTIRIRGGRILHESLTLI